MRIAKILRRAGVCALFMLASQALADPAARTTPGGAAPVRFALTFDDGPTGQEKDNPTQIVLDALAENPVQRGIKGIFFVQTRSSDGGATERGRALIRREHAQGHLVALHDGSTSGHRSHRNLDDSALEKSLSDGAADIVALVGQRVTLLRPPYWVYDERTLAAYSRHGLSVLLTDISANDGKAWGFRASPRRFVHMAMEMARVQDRLLRGELPEVEGVTPVIVTFHDTNDYTAAHMREYLQMLVVEAHSAGMMLAEPSFYDDAAELERAGLKRSGDQAGRDKMVPQWWRLILF
jgi:peptidoglycan/xylan/chitin deacetylase (PgdA/CDA1 family)